MCCNIYDFWFEICTCTCQMCSITYSVWHLIDQLCSHSCSYVVYLFACLCLDVCMCVLGCFWLRKKSQKMRKSTSIWPCYPWMIGNLRKHGNGSTKLSRWRQHFHVLVCKMNFWRKKNLKISFTSALHIIRRASNQASSNAVFNV